MLNIFYIRKVFFKVNRLCFRAVLSYRKIEQKVCRSHIPPVHTPLHTVSRIINMLYYCSVYVKIAEAELITLIIT